MKAWYASFHGTRAVLYVISRHGPLHYIPVSARCSLSLCPPESAGVAPSSTHYHHNLLLRSPIYPSLFSVLARYLVITWRHLNACVRGSSSCQGYNIAEQAVPWPAAVLGTVLSRPQHLLSHIWQHWRDLTGIAACQMELSAPLLKALSNKANLSPPQRLTIPFYCINKSFLLLYLFYRDGLKQKTHKIATKAPTHSAVVTWINITRTWSRISLLPDSCSPAIWTVGPQ